MPSGSTDFLPKAAEAAHLTAALRRAGVLGQESVRDVTIESARVLLVSRITRLCLSYDGAAPDGGGVWTPTIKLALVWTPKP